VHHALANGEKSIHIHPVVEGVKRRGFGAEKKVEEGDKKAQNEFQ